MKEKTTKTKSIKKANSEMRPEYDFSNAVHGKYYKHVMKGCNVVILDPDVAAVFETLQAVNEALRNLMHVTRETERLTKRSGTRSKKRRGV